MARNHGATRKNVWLVALMALGQLLGAGLLPGFAQDAPRPGLFFREDWKESPAALPVAQKHVANAELILQLHGPGHEGIKKSNHDKPADDPFYIWSGEAKGNWALSLRHRTHSVDLSRQARVVWRSKQQGLRQLRIILQLGDGTWLVSEESDGPSKDWRMKEFVLADTRWFRLDIETIVEGALVTKPDLSRVNAVGFTDLMRGGRSLACSRLDWIEVYGFPVPGN